MNKKNIIKKTAAVLLGLALTVGATGCDFIVTNAERDYKQTVATVDITKSLGNTEYANSKTELSNVLKGLSSTITKRDLVSAFMSYGYQYVQSYGYSYEQAFEASLDILVNREIMLQYAIAHYINEGKTAYPKADKYSVQNEIAILTYFLNEDGDTTEYDRVEYNLRKSFNSSLDSIESDYIEEEEGEEHSHGSRTTPTGVNTEKEDYYAKVSTATEVGYDVYTGRNTPDVCIGYEKVDGSTKATRQKAYNRFLANLQSYSLIKDGEDTSKLTELEYYNIELASALGQALINKYYEAIEEKAIAGLDESSVTKAYAELYDNQEETYKNDTAAFATAMDSVSDTSSLVYGLENFGFVYNILLPFSQSQTVAYTEAQNMNLSKDELYGVRAEILEGVKGKDLRSEWFDEHDHANYAYSVGEGEAKKWYFFENSTKNTDRYEALDHYLGLIPFNGKVEEETMEATSESVTVDDVLDEYLGYAKDTLGLTVVENETGYKNVETYYETDAAGNVVEDKDGNKKVDYSKFVYRSGKIDVDFNSSQYFNKTTNLYKLLSYANELMFAYSTDTGCLNKYMGYSVSPYTTNYMKEFEYAAQWAVKEGVGAYAVCPTDYGWHIIITTFVYNDGYVYGETFNYAEKDTEGTFSNIFYESLKESVVSNDTQKKENSVLLQCKDSVTRYKKAYKDLLELQA